MLTGWDGNDGNRAHCWRRCRAVFERIGKAALHPPRAGSDIAGRKTRWLTHALPLTPHRQMPRNERFDAEARPVHVRCKLAQPVSPCGTVKLYQLKITRSHPDNQKAAAEAGLEYDNAAARMIRTPEELRYVPVLLPHVALTERRPKPEVTHSTDMWLTESVKIASQAILDTFTACINLISSNDRTPKLNRRRRGMDDVEPPVFRVQFFAPVGGDGRFL
jgi:hypothetical protein